MTTDKTPTPNPDEQFRQKFSAVLQDLQVTAREDGEAMAMIGILALQLADKLGQQSWSEAKQVMSAANYAEMLQVFDEKGNAYHQAGSTKQAYAVQALAASLVARSRRQDQTIAEGEKLLDALIDHTIAVHRREMAKRH